MSKKVTLIIATIISFYYCFRFGYIWTAYGHGGQIAGIPFAVLMLILTVLYFLNRSSFKKEMLFAFAIIYFFTLAGFSLTIEIIRESKENYFAFLYYEPGGYVNQILVGWVALGTVAYIIIRRALKSRFHNQSR